MTPSPMFLEYCGDLDHPMDKTAIDVGASE